MTRTLGLLLALTACYGLALHAFGCSDDSRSPVPANAPVSAHPGDQCAPAAPPTRGDQAPHRRTRTPRGVAVDVPAWLDLHPSDRDAALAEIDTVTPDPDARIDHATRGVPVTALVVILDPGAYYEPASPTGLASGAWSGSTIWCAWRPVSSDPRRLPALAHELRHLLTQDPLAGH